MEQFSLEKHLKNPSSKVVTRDGRPVRIICTDRKGKSGNIVGLIGTDESVIYVWNNDGKHIVSEIPDNDLFFADNDELTEFENKLFSVISEVWQNYMFGRETDFAETVKEYSSELLDLARKELQITDYLNGYAQGKQDTLKVALESLPKWKKSTLPIPDEEYPTGFNGIYFCYRGYCIDYKKLFEKLPKEE